MKVLRFLTFCLLTAFCSVTAFADLPAPISSEQTLSRSENDPRVRKYIIPNRIVWQSGSLPARSSRER